MIVCFLHLQNVCALVFGDWDEMKFPHNINICGMAEIMVVSASPLGGDTEGS